MSKIPFPILNFLDSDVCLVMTLIFLTKCQFFEKPGYPASVIQTAHHRAQQTDRQSALQTSQKENQSATVVTRGYAMYRNSLKLAWMFLYAGFYCSKNNTTIRSPNSRTFVTLELWSTCRSRHPYIFSKSKR